MKGIVCIAALLAAFTALSASARADAPAPPRPPAQYRQNGSFAGGSAKGYTVISGVRFGKQDDGAMRMVLDLDSWDGSADGGRKPASAHPVYSVELLPYPYRLVVRMQSTLFDAHAKVMSTPALPFSVVAEDNGMVKEMQVFLTGPSEFKVIEVDDPAKLSIDVRPLKGAEVPDVYTVQLTGSHTPSEAFALVEQGKFPEGFTPKVLVLGKFVVIEDVFTDPAKAAEMDTALRSMGYSSVINERRGNELPQP